MYTRCKTKKPPGFFPEGHKTWDGCTPAVRSNACPRGYALPQAPCQPSTARDAVVCVPYRARQKHLARDERKKEDPGYCQGPHVAEQERSFPHKIFGFCEDPFSLHRFWPNKSAQNQRRHSDRRRRVRIPIQLSDTDKKRRPRLLPESSCGGAGGIRTLGTLITYTRFPIVLVTATSILLHMLLICNFEPAVKGWWALGDSNPGPSGYEPDALTN